MYKGRIENTSTHQERINPALRTLQERFKNASKTHQHLNNALKDDSRTYRKFILTITVELI